MMRDKYPTTKDEEETTEVLFEEQYDDVCLLNDTSTKITKGRSRDS